MKQIVFILLLSIQVNNLSGQQILLTTAESSDYQSTSTYDEVISFFDQLIKSSDNIRKEILAVSGEEREIPLYILADPMPQNPNELLEDDRIVVYYQANIHAGEVEGKEATQMLARELLNNPNDEFYKNIVLLICPILNADGNEKFDIKNRTRQNGPVNGVGVRHNAQQLDLNRDAMKLESPEIRGMVTNVLNRWDPAITVDCHTTNGSYHEEPVTFTWMMNPNGDRNLINFMRDDMMPKVHETLFEKYKVENVFYGEFIDRLNLEKGWISYASEPRYLVNYVGVRNRLSILNENYVYADYKTRVWGSYHLLWSILDYAVENKIKIIELLAEADKKMLNRFSKTSDADSFALEYKGIPTPEKISIKAFETDTIPGMKGYWRYKKSDRKRTVTVPYIADYIPTKSIVTPFAYLLEIQDKRVLKNLERHGIEMEELSTDMSLEVEVFKIENLTPDQRLNQGHYTNKIEGKFVTEEKEFSKGTLLVRTDQKLGNLASYLLEPQSDDGLFKWNYFDKYLAPQWGRGYYDYPVYRVVKKVDL